MVDIVDAATRSRLMSGIRGRNTKPELLIRSLLHREGFRFRLHDRTLRGRPDLVLRRCNAVIFVHGCFWHGHDCHLFRYPVTRADFWRAKIAGNRKTDRRARQELLRTGWRVGIVWECAIRGSAADTPKVARRIARWLRGNRKVLEIRDDQ